MLISSECRRDLKTSGFINQFKIQISGPCREEDCSQARYSYHRNSCQGPNFWSRVTPCWGTCSSFHQSPVNIVTGSSLYRPLGHLQFNDVCARVGVKLVHKGHAPHYHVEENSTVVLCNVPRQGEDLYLFKDVHVHLGRSEERGSEHALDGAFFPMEAHLIFMNAKYSNIRKAKQKPGGLAVIGVMMEIEKTNRKGRAGRRRPGRRQKRSKSCGNTEKCKIKTARRMSYVMERYYRKISRHVWNSTLGKNGKISLDITEDISLNDILPDDWSYYTYHGSLTTPPCFETVQWIVMRCPIRISREAYEALANVPDLQGHPLSKFGIRRPLQRGTVDHPKVTVERNFRCGSIGNRKPVCPRRG